MYYLKLRAAYLGLLMFFLLCTNMASAQNSKVDQVYKNYQKYDVKYGLEPKLYKGIKYYKPHFYKFGHPFWKTDESRYGAVLINGTKYDSLLLKYDVYLDNILFKFTDNFGASTEIILDKGEVQSFWIQKNEFIRVTNETFSTSFAHLVYKQERIALLQTYSKTFGFSGSSNTKEFGYSKLGFKRYIMIDNEVRQVKNTKHLLKALPIEIRNEISQYINSNKIKVRNTSDAKLIALFEYINSKL